MGSNTNNFGKQGDKSLYKPTIGELGWGQSVNDNFEKIVDGLNELLVVDYDQLSDEAKNKLTYGIKGAVDNYTDLPTSNNDDGDIYIVRNTVGANLRGFYQWNGTAWVFLAELMPTNISINELSDTPSSKTGHDQEALVLNETSGLYEYKLLASKSELDDEITNRVNADTNLGQRIDNNETDITNLQNSLNTEEQNRIDGDNNLQTQINQANSGINNNANGVQDLDSRVTDIEAGNDKIYRRPVSYVIDNFVSENTVFDVNTSPSDYGYVAGDYVAINESGAIHNGNIYEVTTDDTWGLKRERFIGLSVILDNDLQIYTYNSDGQTGEYIPQAQASAPELLADGNRPVRRVIKEIVTDQNIVSNAPSANSYVAGDRVALFDTSDPRNGNIYEAQSDDTWLLIETAFNGLSVINLSDNTLSIFTGSTWESAGALPQDLINFVNKWDVDTNGIISFGISPNNQIILNTINNSLNIGANNSLGSASRSLFIGESINAGENNNSIVAGKDIDVGVQNANGNSKPNFIFGHTIRKLGNAYAEGSFIYGRDLWLPDGNYNDKFLVWNKNIGFQVLQPTERVEIGGGVKVGEALDTKDGTIQFKNNKLQGRQNGAWKDLISDYLNDEALYLQPFNIISNGDFEIGLVGWVVNAPGDGNAQNSSYVAISNTEHYKGLSSVSLFTPSLSYMPSILQTIFLPKGTYTIKFHAKGSGNTSGSVDVYDNNNAIISSNPYDVTTSWTGYSISFNITENNIQPITIKFNDVNPGTILYIDNINLMLEEGLARAINNSVGAIDTKIAHSYTKIINGETDHFLSDGLDWIEFTTFANSGIDIGLASGFVSLYSNSGTGFCSVTTDYKRLKNYLLSTMFNYDRGSQTGENATFNIFFNRNLSGQFYSFDFKFDNGVCGNLDISKDGGSSFKTIPLKNANGDLISLSNVTDYKIDVISNDDGTADLYLDGVLQRTNTTDKHTVDGLSYTWGTSGIGANFQQTGLKFNVRYFNLYQKNEVI